MNDPKVEKQPPVPPFVQFCCAAIPQVFDDSLSYYEALCAMWKYLNDTVNVINNNALVTEEYIAKFDELKSYVEHYFDNLDVQEEINNKLDQMALDGTLQEIITQYIQANTAWCFDTVAEMVAGENLINGSFAQTLGYNAKNDGGAGLYKIRTITNDDVVDGGAIIEMADDTLVAELIYKDSIIPEQYGCYGDGTHDDTVAFKKLVTYITSKDLPLVGEGNYLLSEAITLDNINITMPVGKITTNYGITISEANNKTLILPKVISTIINANANGVTLFECYTNSILINRIEGFNKGLVLTATSHGCVYNTIEIGEITNCLQSIVLQTQSNGWVNENTFIGGRLLNTSDYVSTYGSDIIKINLSGTSVHRVNNNYFVHICLEGDEGSSNGLKLKLSYTQTNKFEMCRWEGTSPKVDATNSDYDFISDGYNANNISFVNDSINVNFYETTSKIVKAGRANNYYKDIQVSGNTYPIFNFRNSTGQISAKVMCDGFIAVTPSTGKDTYKLTSSGLNAWDNEDANYIMLRNYLHHTVACNADGTNRCFVISPSTNVTGAAFLWVHDGHLYVKVGSAPSTATDGTQLA